MTKPQRVLRYPGVSRVIAAHLRRRSENLNNFGDYLNLSFYRAIENNGGKRRIYWLQSDCDVTPRVASLPLLTVVALDSVALAAFRIGRVAQLDEHTLALASSIHRCGEETVRAVGNAGLHRLPNDLRNEHTGAQLAARVDANPLKIFILDVLRIAKRAGSRFERDKRHARFVALRRSAFHKPEPSRQRRGRKHRAS